MLLRLEMPLLFTYVTWHYGTLNFKGLYRVSALLANLNSHNKKNFLKRKSRFKHVEKQRKQQYPETKSASTYHPQKQPLSYRWHASSLSS